MQLGKTLADWFGGPGWLARLKGSFSFDLQSGKVYNGLGIPLYVRSTTSPGLWIAVNH